MSILGRGGKENDLDDELVAYPASSARSGNDRPASEVRIGKTIVIRGELTGEEDLTVEGRVEGKIDLSNHQLLVGPDGNVSAEVLAKTVTVTGRMEGNLNATERVVIQESGSLVGDIRAPRVIIEDGAKFKGSVDMDVEAPAPTQKMRVKIGNQETAWVDPAVKEEQPATGKPK